MSDLYAAVMTKARDPRDGDGDGWIDDGRPTRRRVLERQGRPPLRAVYEAATKIIQVENPGESASEIEFRSGPLGDVLVKRYDVDSDSSMDGDVWSAGLYGANELQGARLAEALDMKAPRVDLIDGAVVQDRITGEGGWARESDAILSHPAARHIGLFDYLTGNVDRHWGNILITEAGEPVGIDHSHLFEYDTTSPFTEMAGIRGDSSGVFSAGRLREYARRIAKLDLEPYARQFVAERLARIIANAEREEESDQW